MAHNPAGAWALRASLRPFLDQESSARRPSTLVFSCLRDKPLSEMAQILFPLFDRVIFSPIASPRATPVDALMAAAQSTGTPAQAANSASAAIHAARSANGGIVVVCGSVYLVGEIRALLLGLGALPHDPPPRSPSALPALA